MVITLEQVAQRGHGFSALGDTQNLAGHSYDELTLFGQKFWTR